MTFRRYDSFLNISNLLVIDQSFSSFVKIIILRIPEFRNDIYRLDLISRILELSGKALLKNYLY